MTKNRDIEWFRNLPYPVILTRREDAFFVMISELALVVEDRNLATAYTQLHAEKDAYFQKMFEMKIPDQIPLPDRIRRRSSLADGLLQFALKSAIIASIALLAGLASVPFFDAFVVKRLVGAPRATILTFDRQLDRAFQKLGQMSPEERERSLEVLRTRLSDVRPYVAEVRRLWDDEVVESDERDASP